MDRHVRERVGAIFDALGHTTRLRIVELLLNGEKTVNDIAANLDAQQSSISQHLQVLTRVGILTVEQRGTSRYYRVLGQRIGLMLTMMEEYCRKHNLYGSDTDLTEGNDEFNSNNTLPIEQHTTR